MIKYNEKGDKTFLGEVSYKTPSRDEIDFIALSNEQCSYYALGMDTCRRQIIERSKKEENLKEVGFLPCKEVSDNYYRCMTYDKFGKTVEELEGEQENIEMKNFQNCFWKNLYVFSSCRKYHDEVIRLLFRVPDSPLKKFVFN